VFVTIRRGKLTRFVSFFYLHVSTIELDYNERSWLPGLAKVRSTLFSQFPIKTIFISILFITCLDL